MKGGTERGVCGRLSIGVLHPRPGVASVLETAKKNMSEDEWGFWMEGKPAKGDIKSPQGAVMEKAGAVPSDLPPSVVALP